MKSALILLLMWVTPGIGPALDSAAFGSPAATQPTTLPATRPAGGPRKIAFLIHSSDANWYSANFEVSKAILDQIQGMDAADRFNIYFCRDAKTCVSMRPGYLKADGAGFQAARDFISHLPHRNHPALGRGIALAVQSYPDTVWVISDGDVSQGERDACLALAKSVEPSWNGRLCTAVFEHQGPHQQRWTTFLWDLAHARNGICIDRTGKEIATRPDPNPPQPPPAPPPPRKPGIFQ